LTVKRERLAELKAKLKGRGRPCSSKELDAAIQSCDHALESAGFAFVRAKKTGERGSMVDYEFVPRSSCPAEEAARRVENAWARDAAFDREEHALTVSGHAVELDFVTWWSEDERYYTGRIEVRLD
jgi:hypothetical protein